MQDTKENLVLLTVDVNDPRKNEELHFVNFINRV